MRDPTALPPRRLIEVEGRDAVPRTQSWVPHPRRSLTGRLGPAGMLNDDDFDLILRESWQRLVRLAALLLGDPAAAEDIVQDAFANTYRRWSRMNDTSGANAYIRTAVINGSRSFLRRRGGANSAGRPSARDEAAADTALLLAEDQRAMRRAIQALPRRQREVLVLRYWSDLSEAEIARTLRVSRGTVKSSAARGLASLNKILEKTDDH